VAVAQKCCELRVRDRATVRAVRPQRRGAGGEGKRF
jgi:hypothetical protein